MQSAAIQEVFHVYLNKIENYHTHLFLVILGNNLLPWDSLVSRNTQSSRTEFLIFIFWFETVSEDEWSNFKRLKCCLKRNVLNLSRPISLNLSRPISLKDMKFFSFIYCT